MGVRYNVAILANAGVAGALAWDHKTQHKLRQMKGEWSPRQSAIRIANLIPWQPAMSSEGVQERHGMDGAKLYFSVGGRVYDATESETFRETYPKYAGADATFSLARLSVDVADINRRDWTSLTHDDIETMDDWLSYFDQTFLCVGTLASWQRPTHDN